MREAVVDAKVAVREIQEAVARTERELSLERQRLADAARRGPLAGEIQGAETLPHPPHPPPSDFLKRAHTYSIVAYDSTTGDLGIAVQSKFPNVGGLVPWARAGVGAVATQALSNTDYGEKGLELLARGATAPEAMRIIMRSDPQPSQRQGGMVDAHGNAASWTGDSTFDWAGGRTGGGGVGGKGQMITGHGYAAQANIMVSDATVRNMPETSEHAPGSAAARP